MGREHNATLAPYVPRLLISWLHDQPRVRHRSVDGSVVFADISGFTTLTETLARQGKVGGEEMGDILNLVFGDLLDAAYLHGGGLVKWGGDAVLLLFHDADHALRAVAAAEAMQACIARVGKLETSGGPVELRMSIGVHTGAVDFLLLGDLHRELVVAGPEASAVALLEKAADADDVVVSDATLAALAATGVAPGTEPKGPGHVLRGPTGIDLAPLPPRPVVPADDVDLRYALCAPLREHLLGGEVEHEHRNVAVGFVQFKGSDALARRSAEDLVEELDALVHRCQEVAEANGITLLGTDLDADGGKVILISGAPVRAGDDEGRVLSAVRTLVDHRSELELRAGVTSGRVFAGDYGPPYRRNYSVAGDCVNLAARLMANAAPGEVLTTAEVLERVPGRFRTTVLPPLTVKGKRDPVEARRVDTILFDRARADPGGLPLFGRERELAVLGEAVESARRGEGRVVDLCGPSGIGKSRLLAEVVATSGATVYWIDGDVYSDATPYRPIRAFVRRQLGLAADADPTTVATAFASLVEARAPHMAPWLPLIGLAVDADLPMTDVVADLDVGARKERLEWAISELLAALLTPPALLVFNDAHLMDDATVDLLRRLTADAPDRPWVVVASYRPDDRAVVAEGTILIELGPLDPPAAEEMVTAMTAKAPLAPHRVTNLLERAGGHPLFLRELVTGATSGDDADALPETVEAIFASRIDRLTPDRRRILRTAAVLGLRIELDVLDAVLEADGHQRDAVELRSMRELMVDDGGGRVRFRHQLIRDSAYEALPFRRREQLHAVTAQVIEARAGATADQHADVLSLHCFHGKRFPDAWRYSITSARRARARYANAEAAVALERALEAAAHLPELPPIDRARAQEDLGDVCFELGEFDRAIEVLQDAWRSPGRSTAERARSCMKAALVEETRNRYESSLQWIAEGLTELDGTAEADATALEGALLARRARILHLQGDDAAALPWAEQAVACAERSGDLATLAYALEHLDRVEVALGVVTAVPRAARSLEIYEALGDLTGQGRILISLGMRDYFLGRWPEAIEHYRRAAVAYRRAGREWTAATADANVAEVLMGQGHLEEAREIFDRSMRVWRGVKAESEVSFGEYQLGRLVALERRFDEAHERFARARAFCESVGEDAEVQVIDAFVAEALVLEGRAEEALAAADRALADALATPGLVATVPLLHQVRGRALAALGRGEAAVEALRAALEAARSREALHDVATTLAGLRAHADRLDPEELAGWAAEEAELRARLGLSGLATAER